MRDCHQGHRAVGALRKSAGVIDPGRVDAGSLRSSVHLGNNPSAKVAFRIRNLPSV